MLMAKRLKVRWKQSVRVFVLSICKLRIIKLKNITEYRNIITYLEQISIGRLLKTKQLVFFLKTIGIFN